MFFSREAKRTHGTIEELRKEIESVKIDLEVLKGNVEEDIADIKNDFRELVHFLEESTDVEAEKAKADMAAEDSGDSRLDMQAESASWRASLAQILEMTTEMKTEVDGLKKNVQSETGSIKVMIKEEVVAATKKLDDARKDIKNKSSYSLSRLRT